ncbi:MAG: DUF192 domain-containing protein [Pseudomonadota bacterium]
MRFFILISAAVLWSAAAIAQLSELVIEDGEQRHVFQVELADEPEEISRGLMERTDLPRDHGMIFDFGEPREANMWMRNTPLPLDMLFIAADGRIMAIAKNTRPYSERIINPGIPVKSVLELNAGVSDELGISPGDTVRHSVFDNVEAAVSAND